MIPGVRETRDTLNLVISDIHKKVLQGVDRGTKITPIMVTRQHMKIILQRRENIDRQLRLLLADKYEIEEELSQIIVMPEEETKTLDMEGAVKAVLSIVSRASDYVGILILARKRGHGVTDTEFSRIVGKIDPAHTPSRTGVWSATRNIKGDAEDIDSWLQLNGNSRKNKRIVEVAKIASPFIPNLRKTT